MDFVGDLPKVYSIGHAGLRNLVCPLRCFDRVFVYAFGHLMVSDKNTRHNCAVRTDIAKRQQIVGTRIEQCNHTGAPARKDFKVWPDAANDMRSNNRTAW